MSIMPEKSSQERKFVQSKDSPNPAADAFMESHEKLKRVLHGQRDDNLVTFPSPELFDPERESTIRFLAMESRETSQWKTIYQSKMLLYNISEQDILDELRFLDKTATKNISVAFAPSKSRPTLLAVPEDVVIYCWPYHAEAPDGAVSLSYNSIKVDPIVAIVTIFGAVWLITSLLLVGWRFYSGSWYFVKAIPFILLPLLGLLKGLTHLRVSRSGLILQSASGKSNLRSKMLPWTQIKRAYVSLPKDCRTPLAGKLILELTNGHRDIALKKIASAAQWRKLVEAMSRYIDVSELDPCLLDGINQGTTRDPSYTKLWLDALTAPPRRERLQPLSPGVELQKGQYRIEKLLGSGGQGSAYLAVNKHEKVVLKEYILPVYVDVKVRRQALEDFEHESRILGSLHHKGIVGNLGSFIEDHRAYLVLEYVPGRNLRQLVEENGALSERDSVKFGIEMCDILSYLHGQTPPVVHQDFTPDNLLVSQDGSLKLIDFMVAKQCVPESCSSTIVGKRHFMPPEQFRGKATPRSDIYALGCSLYFMLTGCEPEPMSSSHPTLQNNNVSGEMNKIVERATMLDQHQRYQDATSVSQDLHALMADEQLSA
jgi:tRNA A-37 threonylcarbamoyl transferase component Bud32